MLSSIASLGSIPCDLPSLFESRTSRSFLGKLQTMNSLPGHFVVDRHFIPLARPVAACQIVHHIEKQAAAEGYVGCQVAPSAGCELLERRHMSVSTICRSSSSSGSGRTRTTEDIPNAAEFVEIGTIAETHGLSGELRVRSLTDFPEERFEMPGVRWIRRITMGKPSMRQVELVEGREIFGKQPSWLITLKGFDTPEKASELLGATMLVRADERPTTLEADEDYVPDLVGMTVVIQETKEEIGTIVDVHSSGASDLLRVQLNPSSRGKDIRIWVPYVKDIVPVVDNDAKRVEITPPEGLLELNVPKEGPSKKEIRKQERRIKAILAAVRKRLTALGQEHVLEGLCIGEDSQRHALMDQLMSINFGLFERALTQALGLLNLQQRNGEPEPPSEFPCANWTDFENWSNVKTYKKRPANSENDTARWWYKGLQIVANGEVAVIVLAGGQSTRLGSEGPTVKGMLTLNLPESRSLFELQAERLRCVQVLVTQMYPESTPQIPWLILTSDATDRSTRKFFAGKKFFGLDESQVWFVKQDSLPCISCNPEHAILLESPWKMAVAPLGNGGLFSALHRQGFLERLSERGVRYVQVYSVDNALVRVADPVFFGYAHERKADVGIKVVKKNSPEEAVGVLCLMKATKDVALIEENNMDIEEVPQSDNNILEQGMSVKDIPLVATSSHYTVLEYSEIPSALRTAKEGDELVYWAAHICVNLFSVEYLRKLVDADVELGFHPALKSVPCVEKDESGFKVPGHPNGIKLEQYIFDAFKYCEPEKVALLEVERSEEFAPIKNSVGQGVSDTAETASGMVLALRNHKPAAPDQQQENEVLQLLRAYVNGI